MFSEPFHLPVCPFFCFTILPTIFGSKFMYIKCSPLYNRRRRVYLLLYIVSRQFPIRFIVVIVRSTSYSPFDLVFAYSRSPVAIIDRVRSLSSRRRSNHIILRLQILSQFIFHHTIAAEERVTCLALF